MHTRRLPPHPWPPIKKADARASQEWMTELGLHLGTKSGHALHQKHGALFRFGAPAKLEKRVDREPFALRDVPVWKLLRVLVRQPERLRGRARKRRARAREQGDGLRHGVTVGRAGLGRRRARRGGAARAAAVQAPGRAVSWECAGSR
jgi:hypothetical protein